MLIYLCSCRKCKINQCRLSHNSTQLNSASGAFKKTGFSLKKTLFFYQGFEGFFHGKPCSYLSGRLYRGFKAISEELT